MQSFPIPVGVTKTLRPRPIDSSVPPQPGTIQASPLISYSGYDPTAISVVPAVDGLSAAVTMLKPNVSTVITNGCQNSVNSPISGQVEITSPPNPATGFDYSVD